MRNGRTSRNRRATDRVVGDAKPAQDLHAAVDDAPDRLRADHRCHARFMAAATALIEHPGRVPNDEPRGVQVHLVVGEHVTTGHPVMTAEDWQKVYRDAWDLYYSQAHIETIFRRAKASGIKPVRLLNHILQFYFTFIQENVHPLQGGYFRRKLRRSRRSGMARENPLVFYPRRVREVVETHTKLAAFYLYLHKIRRRVERDDRAYTDPALTPIAAPRCRPARTHTRRRSRRLKLLVGRLSLPRSDCRCVGSDPVGKCAFWARRQKRFPTPCSGERELRAAAGRSRQSHSPYHNSPRLTGLHSGLSVTRAKCWADNRNGSAGMPASAQPA